LKTGFLPLKGKLYAGMTEEILPASERVVDTSFRMAETVTTMGIVVQGVPTLQHS
jgi:hypothetical protein